MKLISSIKDSYLRSELIFAIDILLSLVASIIAIFGVRGLVGASFYFPRFLVVYLSVAIIGSVILFLWTKSFHERIRIAIVESMSILRQRSRLMIWLRLLVRLRYPRW